MIMKPSLDKLRTAFIFMVSLLVVRFAGCLFFCALAAVAQDTNLDRPRSVGPKDGLPVVGTNPGSVVEWPTVLP